MNLFREMETFVLINIKWDCKNDCVASVSIFKKYKKNKTKQLSGSFYYCKLRSAEKLQ